MGQNVRSAIAVVSTGLLVAASSAHGTLAAGGRPWESGRRLEPLSKTALSITGPIRMTPRSITFGSKTVALTPLGSSRQVWEAFLPNVERTAVVYRLGADPGPLLRGTTLCGQKPARFVAMYDEAGVAGVDWVAHLFADIEGLGTRPRRHVVHIDDHAPRNCFTNKRLAQGSEPARIAPAALVVVLVRGFNG